MSKEKNILGVENNNNTHSKLINSSSVFTDYYCEELKTIQRSIALLRQDLPKIIHDELVRSKTNGARF
jgi:hypothetical protein